MDECAEGTHSCAVHSTCHNFVGSFACHCATGFRLTPDGRCVDIDECAEKNGTLCHAHAWCRNLAGGYACECAPGWAGDGYNCRPAAERHCSPEERRVTGCSKTEVGLWTVTVAVRRLKTKSSFSTPHTLDLSWLFFNAENGELLSNTHLLNTSHLQLL